ncbi:MAG: helix-turn-helix domain-containing protein [Clostridiales bacterium]|nr:helix-turn-helix domain-containing protein [Clostridiales bacterium]
MAEAITLQAGGSLLSKLLNEAVKTRSGSLPSGRELAPFAEAFGDKDMVETCLALFENDLNVSKTAAGLYMHRNTLIYRIAKLKRLTGLDVCRFADAVSFIILYRSYLEENGKSGKG